MSTINPTVLITVPKYVSIKPLQPCISPIGSNKNMLPKIKPTSHTAVTTGVTNTTVESRGKKRRLDHLTWEEKIQRKKLKNRVAAQTSRDRKKARMEEMENELKELTEKTMILENKCQSLQLINDSLLEKNQKLDMELEVVRQQLYELQKQQTKVTQCDDCKSLTNGSAVSNGTNPLQQGLIPKDSQSTQDLKLKKCQTVASLWRVIALCLLYKICCSQTSESNKMPQSVTQKFIPANWKNLPKPCLQISQQTWRVAIERAMRLLPKLQAEKSGCLDQWWGPQQHAWNPANIVKSATTV